MAQTATHAEIIARLRQLPWHQLDLIYQATTGRMPMHLTREGFIYYLLPYVVKDALVIPDEVLNEGF